MKSKLLAGTLSPKRELGRLLFAACVMVVGSASAATTGYVSNPTGNSVAWGNAVTSLGATINTNVNFNGISGTGTVTPAIGAFYSATDGVTFSANNITLVSSMSAQGFTTGEGEGVWTPSKLLRASSDALFGHSAQSVTFTFQNGVLGAGVFLVDYYAWNTAQQWTISARDVNGAQLGSFQAISGVGFQQHNPPPAHPGATHKYFLGISSSEANIASVTVSRPAAGTGVGGDIVGLDDFRVAVAPPPIPEPAEWTMLLAGLLAIGLIAARRNHVIG